MKIRLWRKPPVPADHRQALARWVRLRVQLLEDDPMGASRVTHEGMDQAAAIQFVAEILRERESAAS